MRLMIGRADGGVSILAFVEGSDAELETVKWAGVADPGWLPVVSSEVIQDEDVPLDRTFRNAWKADSGAVAVDMPKAREIHRQHMREARGPLLTALDAAYLKSDEGTNDNGAAGSAAKLAKKAIAVQKQALRDVTADPAIDAAQTPEELKAVWPEILNP